MKQESHEEYRNKKYSLNQRFSLGLALEALAKAMRSTYAFEVDLEVNNGMRYLTEFINDVKPCPKMSEKAAEFSGCAHTYLRKYSDSPNTTLLYCLVKNGTGYPIWVAFCEAAVKQMKEKRCGWKDIQYEVSNFYDRNDELPDNLIMHCALRTWGETGEIDVMFEEFKNNKWIEI